MLTENENLLIRKHFNVMEDLTLAINSLSKELRGLKNKPVSDNAMNSFSSAFETANHEGLL